MLMRLSRVKMIELRLIVLEKVDYIFIDINKFEKL